MVGRYGEVGGTCAEGMVRGLPDHVWPFPTATFRLLPLNLFPFSFAPRLDATRYNGRDVKPLARPAFLKVRCAPP